MASCLENMNIPPCIWFTSNTRKNSVVSIISGVLFAVGWWMVIDAASVHHGSIPAGYHMCGILGTVSFILVNSVSNAQVSGTGLYEGGCMGATASKIWLFLGFVLGFASVIASCWILLANYVGSNDLWPGVSLFLQNVLIFTSSLLFKFGRYEEYF